MRLTTLLCLLLLPACHREDVGTPDAARAKLTKLADLAVAHAKAQRSPPRFPMSSSNWAPDGEACKHPEHAFPRNPGDWAIPPWSDVGFAVDGKTAYQFRLTRIGADRSERMVVEARADLNCNGVFSSFTILLDAEGHRQPARVEREAE